MNEVGEVVLGDGEQAEQHPRVTRVMILWRERRFSPSPPSLLAFERGRHHLVAFAILASGGHSHNQGVVVFKFERALVLRVWAVYPGAFSRRGKNLTSLVVSAFHQHWRRGHRIGPYLDVFRFDRIVGAKPPALEPHAAKFALEFAGKPQPA